MNPRERNVGSGSTAKPVREHDETLSAMPGASADELPEPLTFFLGRRERAAVLRALRRHDRCKETALRIVLGIDAPAA